MQPTQRRLANAIRALAMDAVEAANSGTRACRWAWPMPRPPLSPAFLKFDPADPRWADRDRFRAVAGHGSMLIYALLHLCGYERPTMDDIRRFRQLGSPLAPATPRISSCQGSRPPPGRSAKGGDRGRHGDRRAAPQCDLRRRSRRSPHYVIAGDGCLMEGINHEAVGLAGTPQARPVDRAVGRQQDHHRRLDRAVALRRRDGAPCRSGWHTIECDGLDAGKVAQALEKANADPAPA
jgi:transketolase